MSYSSEKHRPLARSFQQLVVYQRAIEVTQKVYETTKRFPIY
jgi:hypothetical protein